MKSAALLFAVAMLVVGCTAKLDDSSRVRMAPPQGRVDFLISDVVTECDFAPFAISSPDAYIPYPLAMLKNEVSGEVFASTTIEADGTVSHVAIDHAACVEFGDIVSLGIARMRFSPAQIGGKPVRSVVRCRVSFDLVD